MKHRVLLALEEPDTLEFYASSLRSAGFDVGTSRPDSVFSAALEHRPDAMVIDGSQPAGQSVCKGFKNHPSLRAIPLVALAPPDRVSQVDGMCDAVLPVDCLPDALVDVIDRLLVTPRETF